MTRNQIELRKELDITPEEKTVIEMEKGLIETLVRIREREGLTQAELTGKCHMKQPVIAQLKNGTHSPRVNSLLKILVPLRYTLWVIPMEER